VLPNGLKRAISPVYYIRVVGFPPISTWGRRKLTRPNVRGHCFPDLGSGSSVYKVAEVSHELNVDQPLTLPFQGIRVMRFILALSLLLPLVSAAVIAPVDHPGDNTYFWTISTKNA
jgi:hypothetical protein